MKDIRQDFPALMQKINGHDLIYFDNAATTHKPQQVIERISHFYQHEYANIYRGTHGPAEQATQLYEHARAKVATFIGAQPEEIIFTSGTTGSINFVATAWACKALKSGDEIVLTQMEHHANLIPWQQVARHTGAVLKFIPVIDDGLLDLKDLDSIITQKTKLVSMVHVSNFLGTHNDIKLVTCAAHAVGAPILIDAAQSVPHQKIDVKKIGCDFLAFSGHKMLGPTGIGVLYIKKEMQEQVPPYQFGGGMVFSANYDDATWQKAPQKYEAGTPPIAQAISFGAAIDFLQKKVDFVQLQEHEAALCAHLIDGLSTFKQIRIIGPIQQLKQKGHVVSFVIDGVHAHDAAAYLDSFGICVRAGHSCAQPLAEKLGLQGVLRASFYLYNTHQEVDFFLRIMAKLIHEI